MGWLKGLFSGKPKRPAVPRQAGNPNCCVVGVRKDVRPPPPIRRPQRPAR